MNYRAKKVKLLDLVAEIARQGKLDAYLTSVGIIITPEGLLPFPNEKALRGDVLKVLRQSQ